MTPNSLPRCKGLAMLWYHGSNQDIIKLKVDDDIQGINTQSATSKKAVYFTSSPEHAGEYANAAAKNLFPFNHKDSQDQLNTLSDTYYNQMKAGMFDLAEATCEALESLESELVNSEEGQVIYPVLLTPKTIINVDFNGEDWGGDKAEKLMELADKKGIDVLIINNVVDKVSMDTERITNSIAIVFNDDVIHHALSLDSKDILQLQNKIVKVTDVENDNKTSILPSNDLSF